MAFKINKDNFDTYSKVLELYWKCLQKYMDDELRTAMAAHSPTNVMREWESKIPKSQLYTGLKQAIGDVVAHLRHYPSIASELDKELLANNLPNFRILAGIVRDSVNKVMNRKKIRNLEEYYIIKEIIDDTASGVSDEDRSMLSSVLSDFETNQRPR